MRRTRAFLFIVSLSLIAIAARAESFHASIIRVAVDAEPQFETLIWYPTTADEGTTLIGPWSAAATFDAPIAEGKFPIILLSHGGGLTGGDPLSLSELSHELAHAGFIVVAPFHGQTPLRGRVRQLDEALAAARETPRISSHLDPDRVYLPGFSLGGAAVLEAAGARPDLAHFNAYCDAHPEDAMSCRHAPGSGGRGVTSGPPPPSPKPLAVRAIALLDPFGALFTRDGLTALTVPVLIMRPEQSELPAEGNALALADALPRPPTMKTIGGDHFVFTDLCTPARRTFGPSPCHGTLVVPFAHIVIAETVIDFFRAAR
jgi:predicted dienelactone hydrolase